MEGGFTIQKLVVLHSLRIILVTVVGTKEYTCLARGNTPKYRIHNLTYPEIEFLHQGRITDRFSYCHVKSAFI